ncbi:MAG: metallophosphatase [Clostridia bacterium]|nr:metallophosphatase [Clostridia bacterium]
MRKILSLVLTLVLLLSVMAPFASAEAGLSDDVVILFTNDVHTYIDNPISYDVITGVKAELKKQYANVLLADAGDHIQGTAYGSMDKGETIIKLMNAAGYDVATLGNHEFDYGMEGCMNVIEWAEYPYVSCNFYHEDYFVRNENVLDSYKIFECGAQKIAFIGITTPETFTKSTPAYFQDETGAYIYGIAGGEDGALLYADVQDAVDAAKAEGATTIIALGHLGVDEASAPWTSKETIAQVSGLDAFIDGHSHTLIEGEEVADKDGNAVVLAQTGEYFDRIGMMVIDAETGAITVDMIEVNELTETTKDAEGKDITKVIG